MSKSRSLNSQLSLSPLGAGDLIDRSVRFYRKNFWTFILIAAPPIIVGAVFLIGWMILARSLFAVNSAYPNEATFYTIFLSLGSFFIWTIQLVAVFVVMGGASRNFVRHILFGEAITLRETYKNVKSRLFGLIGISSLLVISLGFFGLVMFFIGLWVGAIVIGIFAYILSPIPILAFLVSLALGVATLLGTLWVFFLVVSRFVYVPQAMLVEGQGAFSAISRSTTLAGKNINRVGALFIFTLVTITSAVALLYIPLYFYSWANGIDFFAIQATDTVPAWIEISKQVVFEISLILLTPILMIGLCLLYVDERVRGEGYDIELMAAKQLGAIPSVPKSYVNPLQPAISNSTAQNVYKQVPQTKVSKTKNNNSNNSTLGLE